MKLSTCFNSFGCKTSAGKTSIGMTLVVWLLWAASQCAAADTMLVQTNTVAVGESCVIEATGSNIVVAKEGLIRLVPVGTNKLVMSGVKAGQTDLLMLDDSGQVKKHYFIIITEPVVAQPAPPPVTPPQRPTRKVKVYDGGKVTEFEMNY